jgi:hypothetical protein
MLIGPKKAAFFEAARYECRAGGVCCGFKRAAHLIKRAGDIGAFTPRRAAALSTALPRSLRRDGAGMFGFNHALHGKNNFCFGG